MKSYSENIYIVAACISLSGCTSSVIATGGNVAILEVWNGEQGIEFKHLTNFEFLEKLKALSSLLSYFLISFTESFWEVEFSPSGYVFTNCQEIILMINIAEIYCFLAENSTTMHL